MTWTAAIMPDDALPPDSLVGRMLNVKPTSKEPQIRSSEVRPELLAAAASERAELPLWRVMEDATGSCVEWSAAIKAIRDYITSDVEAPCGDDWPASYHSLRYAKWERDQEIRALLTEQARIAKGD